MIAATVAAADSVVSSAAPKTWCSVLIVSLTMYSRTHVLLNEVQTAIIGYEGCNLLAILD